MGSKLIPAALERAGFSVERFGDHFQPETLDVEWLRSVAARGWIAFSGNKRQRYVADERDAVMRSGLAMFHLMGRMTGPQRADALVKTMPAVVAFLDRHPPPFFAKVYRPEARFPDRPGRVVMSLSLAQWKAAHRGR